MSFEEEEFERMIFPDHPAAAFPSIITNFPKPELIDLRYLEQKEIYLERKVRLITIKEIQKCVLRPHLSPLDPLGRHW